MKYIDIVLEVGRYIRTPGNQVAATRKPQKSHASKSYPPQLGVSGGKVH